MEEKREGGMEENKGGRKQERGLQEKEAGMKWEVGGGKGHTSPAQHVWAESSCPRINTAVGGH